MKNISMVLFDMDGCLIDSEHLNVDLWKEVFETRNIPISYEEILTWRGKSYLDVVGLVDTHTRSREESMALRDVRDQLFWQKLEQNEVQLKAHASEIMDFLDLNGVPYACVTSTFESKAKRMLEHFSILKRFAFVLCGDQVEKPKPDPALYLKAIEFAQVDIKNVLAFEDSRNGIEACNRADVDVIYIPDRGLIDTEGLNVFNQVPDFNEAINVIAPMLNKPRD